MELKKQTEWVLLTEAFQFDEAQLMGGLLSMAGIPVKIERESAGELFGLTVGPLAKIQIFVPLERRFEAEKILAGDIDDDSEEPDQSL